MPSSEEKGGGRRGNQGSPITLLIGSSQIERWDFCKKHASCINVGKSGITTKQLLQKSYLSSLPHPPIRTILVYCGSNDIMKGRKENHAIYQQIITNMDAFLSKMLEKYPMAHIQLISIIQTPRLSLNPDRLRLMKSVNATWQRQYRAHDRIRFVHVNPYLSDPKCFLEDGIHLSDFGYRKLPF
jgi:lysophospholipase L1-like esterase